MNKKGLVYILLLYFFTTFSLQDGHAAWPLLKENDLQKFIQTFPGMYREYQTLGLNINPQNGNISGADKLKRDKEVQRILKENGWNFMFWPKLQTITRGYSVLKYDQVKREHGTNIEKFINNLKNSKWMTPEKKAEIEAAFSKAKKGLSAENERRRDLVHRNDFNVIEKYISQLDKILKVMIKMPP